MPSGLGYQGYMMYSDPTALYTANPSSSYVFGFGFNGDYAD